MSYILLLLLFGLTTIILAETPSEIDRIKGHLIKSAKQLSLRIFLEPPEAASYLNIDLIKNAPHKMNLTKELTKIIHEWSPRLLALDPTCPYYFSKLKNTSLPDEDRNLLSYLQAIESNTTVNSPFVNVLPQSYRNALPLLSIFNCSEFIYSSTSSFFHNIELIIGPNKSELPMERKSNMFSQLYCSLYGWPHFVLVDQTKQPTITYDSKTLLSKENLTDIDFVLTSVAPGSCLFVPPDWIAGIQVNNSILLVFTLEKIEEPSRNETDYEPLPCTETGESTLDTIKFTIQDTFNVSEIGLIVYFYQYLNPPVFDNQYTSKTFLDYFQQDKNVSQLVMKWTPELIDLINNTLFKTLDINQDEKFNVDDYFDIKQADLNQLQSTVLSVLEKLRQTVLAQYNELNEAITKMTQQLGNLGLEENAQEDLEVMMENLPDSVKEKLKEKNVDVKELLGKVKQKTKRPSKTQQRVREDDASVLFDKKQDEEILSIVDQDQEEEITAEPIINEDEPYRTDL